MDKYIELIDKYKVVHSDDEDMPTSYTWVDNTGEIVRCGECKYFNPHIMECEGIGKWFGLENEWSAYDYCSKGERKVQDENHE